MARTGKRQDARIERLRALLEGGDHRAARAEARLLAADGAATELERAAAAEVLLSLAPERGAVIAGLLGLGAACAITVYTIFTG